MRCKVKKVLNFFQIERLRNTWLSAKHQFEASVAAYRSKLTSVYKSLRNATSTLPLHGVTLPYMVPVLEMLEAPAPSAEQAEGEDTASVWEDVSHPLALNIMLSHLDIARIITDQSHLYKTTSIGVVGSLRPIRDLLELFDTRMHLRFLWGHKGCSVQAAERYRKFEQVLRALSVNCEPTAQGQDKETSL